MKDRISDKSAFPSAQSGTPQAGMTYREWLTGQALVGCASNPYFAPEQRGEWAVKLADQVLAIITTGAKR